MRGLLSLFLLLSLVVVIIESQLKSSSDDDEEREGQPRRRVASQRIHASPRKQQQRRPPQEVANCPLSCSCNQSTISCINTDYDGPNLFAEMQPLAFPHLDTIVVTGNRLADISEPLFGTGRLHPALTLVNLTNNRISAISAKTFSGMPKVEYVYLRENQISSVSGKPFESLSHLRLLDLSSALSSSGRSPEFIQSLFDVRRGSLQDLQEIDLSKNGLTRLLPTTFCKLPGVARLLLSGNSLTSFPRPVHCLSSLSHLDLSGNSIRSLPDPLWPSLTAIDLSGNPLECDCEIASLVQLMQEEPNHFLNMGKTVCAGPPSMAGRHVSSLDGSSLCSSKSSFFGHLFLLLLISIFLLVLYRVYRHRIPIPPAFQFGYSSLNEREEPEPHFV